MNIVPEKKKVSWILYFYQKTTKFKFVLNIHLSIEIILVLHLTSWVITQKPAFDQEVSILGRFTGNEL